MNVTFFIILVSLIVVFVVLLCVDWGHRCGEVVSKKISLERKMSGGQMADLADQIAMAFESHHLAFLDCGHGEYYSVCEKGDELYPECWSQWMLLTPNNIWKLDTSNKSYKFRSFWRITFLFGKKSFLRCRASYFNKDHDYHEFLFFDDEFYDEIELTCEPYYVNTFWNRSHIDDQKKFVELMETTIKRILDS